MTAAMHANASAHPSVLRQRVGAGDLIESDKLVERFPDWSGELFSLYALYPLRHHRAAKVRAFVDFCLTVLVRANTTQGLNRS
jgi:DNA-binding transcriptional LysR family regulator